ncbi:hypothetical protein TVAG_453860 [Trichomonas vaginalis G3]|uniref:THUMP domain-containing protein n=1 Tax=Trichomonas vaginalis (strain ATCC PRA-98 / G3) TaxID=412133 RepID=A2DPW2_TRIV3|nr:THUMP domain-containing protein 1 family [Trichomonas vaginalis G3]EAY17558.1 hypothetical protein TVAG_453860 [Trichomonas vaginalis G3]KAI5520602.1 THUMP domain-containing protein 1 family [Trichomonas vaginalis G3]|eukprot:XP_001329693.1 hypothetical protein [Trichomonas vaginalis G3]
MPKGNRKNLAVPPKGSKGWLFTCDINRDQQATRQVIDVLNQLADPLTEGEAEEEQQEEKTLEQELADLKKPNQKQQRWIPYVSEVNGNVFIRFTQKQDDPFVLLERYFEEVRKRKGTLTNKVSKIYPIMYSGFPLSSESLPILQELVNKTFNAEKPVTYEVFLDRKHRGEESGETHDELNNKIVKLVGAPHKPIYRKAEWAVLWQSLGRNLYLSVIPKWSEWCSCNIAKFCASLLKPAEPAPPAEEKKE